MKISASKRTGTAAPLEPYPEKQEPKVSISDPGVLLSQRHLSLTAATMSQGLGLNGHC